jgi:predicted ATPase
MPEEELQEALRTLADAAYLRSRASARGELHLQAALIRDAAYEALLKSRRRELHRLVARTINEQCPALKEAHPEVLARHWTEAGETEPAIVEWSRAGEGARARSAFSQALESYQRAVAVLNLLPESPERDLRELDLTQLVSEMLYITRGYSASETTQAIERAGTLAEKSGNLAHLVSRPANNFTILLGLFAAFALKN